MMIRRSSSVTRQVSKRFQSTTSNIQKRSLYEAPQPKMNIFDRKVHLIHKENNLKYGSEYDYIRHEMAESILERLQIVSRTFPNVAEIGCGKSHVLPKLIHYQQNATENDWADLGVENYILCDNSQKMLDCAQTVFEGSKINVKKMHFDEEKEVPLEPGSLDLIIGGSYLHWINNLPGALAEMRKALRPDGLFVGAMLGGDTLQELRISFVLAEQEREGGVSPHISPLTTIRDAGNLLTRAGYTIPTVDNDFLTVYYPDAFTLMNHLQAMGENNALLSRRPQISRETLYAAAAIYDSLFRTDKGIPATFEIIYMIAWSPDPSQPKPARRGSGQLHMSDLAKEFGTKLHVSVDDDGEEQKSDKNMP